MVAVIRQGVNLFGAGCFWRNGEMIVKTKEISDEYKLLLKRVGEHVSEARRRSGLSQRALAKLADKNQASIAKVEKTPPPDITLRSIYEVTKHIPVSLGEILLEAEKDLDIGLLKNQAGKADHRMALIIEKLQKLNSEDQQWLADMIEGLLAKTRPGLKTTDRADTRSEVLSAQSF